jgi:hypothetical protein
MIKNKLINIFNNSYQEYIKHSSRSNKKTNVLHNGIKEVLEKIFPKSYEVKTEINIKCANASGRKKCDIVVYDDKKKLKYIFPVKFVCCNYKQNKNNYIESLVGEVTLLKISNPDTQIIPINIFPSRLPFKHKNGNIKKYETITEKDLKPYCDTELFKKCIVYLVTIKENKVIDITNYKNLKKYINQN